MKKSLLAVAVAAALPAAAIAQTNVQLYGIGDAAITIANDDASSNGDTQFQMSDGIQSGSRVGVQGSEDLGGGLSATFRFELGLDVDDGDGEGKLFGRQARIGLKGNFGEVRFGRQYTPIFWSSIGYDFSGFGWYNNHFALAGSAGRLDNMIEYRNKFGGVRLILMAAPTESADPNEDDFIYGLGVNYSGGAWGIGGGYHSEGAAQNVIHLGGKVQLGAFGFGLNYGINDRDNGTERTEIALSFGLKLGASGNMVLNYSINEDDAASDFTELGLSYGHSMSKRTNWYVSLGIDDIDGANGAAGTTPTLISAGIRHKF
ncbi:MAG: porin [Burkholderiaceae bacterium]